MNEFPRLTSKLHTVKAILELIYLYFPPSLVTSTPTRPVDNVVITTKGLQDKNIHIIDGTMVENKGKLILTEIFPSVQKT